MSHDPESVMSSAISISGAGSFSDDVSTLSAGDNKMTMPDATSPGGGLFDLGDGDLRIVINGTTLQTHKFLIKKFVGLKDRIRNVGSRQLTDYPALRAFAIDKLEKAALSAVERIRLVRKFNIASWEEPAFLELCERDEAITMSEAGVLGLETVVHVARIREKEQRRRGKEVDVIEGARNGTEDDQPGQPEAANVPAALGNSQATPSTPPSSDSEKAGMPKMESAGKFRPYITSLSQIDETGSGCPRPVKATHKPSFINTPALSPRELRSHYSASQENGKRIALAVPDCNCAVEVPGGPMFLPPNTTKCQCKLPPCAISAFKNLQTQQLAHETNISALETTIEQIQATVTSLKSSTERNTNAVPPAQTGSSSLKDNVRRWLVRQKSDAAIV